jgi:uncharacterized membrane protein YhaH (DUF805 family)
MSLMVEPLRKYAEFEGRARRSEYWQFLLFQFLVILAFFILVAIVQGGSYETKPLATVVIGLYCLVALGLLIPSLAVYFRRLHDSGRSAWWILLGFIPFGGFVLLVFTLLDGTPGPNAFGPDPKGREGFSPPPVVHNHYYNAPPPGAEPEAGKIVE